MQYIVNETLRNFKAWGGGDDTLDALIENDVVDEVEQMLNECMDDSIWTDTEINDFLWFERDSILEYLGMIDKDEYTRLYEEKLEENIVEYAENVYCMKCSECEYSDKVDCHYWLISDEEKYMLEEKTYNEIIDEYGEPFSW